MSTAEVWRPYRAVEGVRLMKSIACDVKREGGRGDGGRSKGEKGILRGAPLHPLPFLRYFYGTSTVVLRFSTVILP